MGTVNNFICNCCCCGLLRGAQEFNAPYMMLKSNYLARIDEDLCFACGTCADERCQLMPLLKEHRLEWLKEPLSADRNPEEWAALATLSNIPLAAGENILGYRNFQEAIAARSITVFQSDACKWGGITGCCAVAKTVLKAGSRYCSHFLGGGIGLLASAHILAAVGGDGLLEADINSNPLREGLADSHPAMVNGNFPIQNKAGLGVEPNKTVIKENLKAHFESK